MEKLSFFDRVSISTVGIAAIVQALQQTLKDAPAVRAAFPFLDLPGGWSYVPFALLILGAATWFVGRSRSKSKRVSPVNSPPDKEKLFERPAFLQPSEDDASRSDNLLIGATRALAKPGPAKDIADSWFMVADLVDDLGRAHGFQPPRRNSPVVHIHLMGRGILPPSLGETIESLHRLRDGALAHPEAISKSHVAAYTGVAQAAMRSLKDIFPKDAH